MEVAESDKAEDLRDNPLVKAKEDHRVNNLVKAKVDHRDEPPDQAKGGEELELKVEMAAVNAQ